MMAVGSRRDHRLDMVIVGAAPTSTGTVFENCTDAYHRGYAEILRGTPGYAAKLDQNNDGVACEDPPGGTTAGQRAGSSGASVAGSQSAFTGSSNTFPLTVVGAAMLMLGLIAAGGGRGDSGTRRPRRTRGSPSRRPPDAGSDLADSDVRAVRDGQARRSFGAVRLGFECAETGEESCGGARMGVDRTSGKGKVLATVKRCSGVLHRFIYRLSNGRVGGKVAGAPVLLLTTTGRSSHKPRTVPLIYWEPTTPTSCRRATLATGCPRGTATFRPTAMSQWKSGGTR